MAIQARPNYILRWDCELCIKELVSQEQGGAIAISHNPSPNYKPIEIPAEPAEGAMEVIGRIVKVWRRK